MSAAAVAVVRIWYSLTYSYSGCSRVWNYDFHAINLHSYFDYVLYLVAAYSLIITVALDNFVFGFIFCVWWFLGLVLWRVYEFVYVFCCLPHMRLRYRG